MLTPRLAIIALTPVLSAQSQQPQTWFFQTDDGAAFVRVHERGAGEPVVVLHGGPAAGYEYLIGIAEGVDRRFVFYDQRGAGLSHCAKADVSMRKHVEDLDTLRTALGLERVTLISHSSARCSR